MPRNTGLRWSPNPVGEIIKLDKLVVVDLVGIRDKPLRVLKIEKHSRYGGGYRVSIRKRIDRAPTWVAVALCKPFDAALMTSAQAAASLDADRQARLFGRIV